MSGNNKFYRIYKYWFGLFKKPVSYRLEYGDALYALNELRERNSKWYISYYLQID